MSHFNTCLYFYAIAPRQMIKMHNGLLKILILTQVMAKHQLENNESAVEPEQVNFI